MRQDPKHPALPFVVGPDGGDRYELGGGEVVIKAMPEQTGIGGFSVEAFPPGFASPEHVHHRDGGVFFILEGSMRIRCGDLDAVAHAGATVYLPRGVPHAFRVEGSGPVRWFNVQSPHGDFMHRTMAMAATSSPGQADPAADSAVIEVLGAPPF